MNPIEFRDGLRELINRTSMENGSNTPDHILADFLMRSLDSLNLTIQARSTWYGRHDAPGQGSDAERLERLAKAVELLLSGLPEGEYPGLGEVRHILRQLRSSGPVAVRVTP